MPSGWEWIIILVVALLLFGGSRLAGLGKGVGRSIREFKEEVKSSDAEQKPEVVDAAAKKGRGKAVPEPVVVPGPVKGEVSVTFQGRGTPEDLARFFLSLSKKPR